MCNIKRGFLSPPPDIMALVAGGPAASAAVQSATKRRIMKPETRDSITHKTRRCVALCVRCNGALNNEHDEADSCSAVK